MKCQPKNKKIIFIVGPTAAGKSELAMQVAKRIDGEIVSCDSMQVYKGLDILSSKPNQADRIKIKHHLIDVVSPNQNFNVSKFVNLSQKLIEEIHSRGKVPVFAGGTGLYTDCLLNGIFPCPANNHRIRRELYKKAKARGGGNYLYTKLKNVDQQAAEKIHPHDIRKIIRALEVYKIAKTPISNLQKQRKGILKDKRFNIYIFGLNMQRDKLYQTIDNRVDRMFKQGAVWEVKRILNKRCSKTLRQALGIKEIDSYLKGEIDLPEAKRLLKRNTRRFAKRQMTWFKKNPRIYWLDENATKNTGKIIRKIV